MFTSIILIFPLIWGVTQGSCPCVYNNDVGEVICDPGTQERIPWDLPDCLSYIPEDLIQRLILSGQNFPEIQPFSFEKFSNLQYIDLSFSNIGEIGEFAFGYLPLETIVLTQNSLTSLPVLFEDPGNNLKKLVLSNNNLTSIDARNLDGLAHLDLQGNKLSDLKPGFFDHLTSLRFLNLRNNDGLQEYITESWHFCENLEREVLNVELESGKKVIQDLKFVNSLESFCVNNEDNQGSVATSCSDDDGHLTCVGDVATLVCELKNIGFKSITYFYPKDDSLVNVENYFEAETNSYFTEINGKDNSTKYVADLKLYGTKFDLFTLSSYIGLRTEKVTIAADTIYMSRSLESPLKAELKLRARVVTITEDIAMNMTRSQFFSTFEADQPVENWASVKEIVTGVGNTSFEIRKLGFIEVQRARILEPRQSHINLCYPRYFSVDEYEKEHNTPPAVFFDQVQMNLQRLAVRTLASTRSNDILAIDMVDHSIMKTSDKNIVRDWRTYIIGQKLIRDRELITTSNKDVPFYKTSLISDLAGIMYDKMSLYAKNETDLLLKLDIAFGRIADMNKNFEDARMMRELYFERELQTLEEIWNSTDTAWHWTFNASRNMEDNIQDSIQQNGEEMFQMQENELKEMLELAKDTVEHDQAVVDKLNEDLGRYSYEATQSIKLQKTLLDETNSAGDNVNVEKEILDENMEKWKEEQLAKAVFGFFKALLGVVAGIAKGKPGAAGDAIAEAAKAEKKLAKIFEGMVKIIEALEGISEIIDSFDIPDVHLPDFEIDGDMALNVSANWRSALENAYEMKNSTSKFNDVKINGETRLDAIWDLTEHEVDPADLKNAMFTYTDRGTQLIQETINFSNLMMELGDKTGELEVAKIDLQNAIDDVERIEQMLLDLQQEHQEYIDWMNQHRDEYQDKCDEFAEAYDEASQATKDAFKKEIMELFNKFKEAFEESNKQYISMMNKLTDALYTKVANLKQHSMVQRSMVMNLYQDFCDGLFYFSFTECYSEHYVGTMSDDFGSMLENLKDIQWDTITSMENLPNTPESFENVQIDLVDETMPGANDSLAKFGPVRSMRETGKLELNPKEFESWLDNFYRIRIDSVQIHVLDDNLNVLPTPNGEVIGFKVYFPTEFRDKDADDNIFSFRGISHVCTSAYFLQNGEVNPIAKCEVDQEFDGVNHKSSHDGVFTIKSFNNEQNILDQMKAIRVILGGSYATRFKE